MGRGWWDIGGFSEEEVLSRSSVVVEKSEGSSSPVEGGLLKGRKAMGWRAEESHDVAAADGSGSFCSLGGRTRRRRRSRISIAFGGADGFCLDMCACRRRSFSLLATARSRSSSAISARRESRKRFLSASGSGGCRPRNSAVVGS